MRPPADFDVLAPPFPRQAEWVNVATLRMDQQRGRPVLVEFWDFCRVNSLRTLPYLKAWHERYAEAGLRVIGVHAGAFEPSRDEAQIEAAVRRLGTEYQPGAYSGPYEAGGVWAVLSGSGTVTAGGREIAIPHSGCHPLVEHPHHTEGVLELAVGAGLECHMTCF